MALRNTLNIDGLRVPTSFGNVVVYMTPKTNDNAGSPALLCIHGNSHSSEVFRHVFHSPLSESNQILAFDLPGHGLSENATDPNNTYTMPAFAKCAWEVLDALKIREVIVFGWSLGGHMGIEMIAAPAAHTKLRGVMIVGTPPIGHGEVDKGFTFGDGGWQNSYAGRSELTDKECDDYAHVCATPPYEPWMTAAVKRSDARFRSIMFNHLVANKAVDNRAVVGKNVDVPLAVVNGADEPFISMEFIRNVKYGNLWRGECIEMPGLLHAPFWTEPAAFQKILDDFVRDCSRKD